jgi:hypothetical protein
MIKHYSSYIHISFNIVFTSVDFAPRCSVVILVKKMQRIKLSQSSRLVIPLEKVGCRKILHHHTLKRKQRKYIKHTNERTGCQNTIGTTIVDTTTESSQSVRLVVHQSWFIDVLTFSPPSNIIDNTWSQHKRNLNYTVMLICGFLISGWSRGYFLSLASRLYHFNDLHAVRVDNDTAASKR